MSFGKRLKILRQEKNLTQNDIAKILGVGRPTVAGYETKGKQADHDKLKKLADFFNVSIDFLLGRTDIRNPNDQPPVEKLYPDINDVEEAMKIIMDQPGLMLNGEALTDEDKVILANSIQIGLRLAEERRRERESNKKEK